MSEPTLHLDFETYCEIDVRQVGAHRYARHPSCEVLILCYKIPSKQKQFWLPHRDGLELPADLTEYIEVDEGTLTAHNASFEAQVWQHVLVARHGAPRVALRRWRCTAARAAAAGMPRALANLGPALRLNVVKDREGTRLINIFCKPRKPSKNNASIRTYPDDKPEEFASFVNYCGTDVDTEEAADAKLPDLSLNEWRVYRHTEVMNDRGLPLDMPAVRAGFEVLQVLEKNVVRKVEALTGGIRPTQRDKMLEFFNTLGGLELENMQAKTIKDLVLLQGDKLEPKTKELLELRIEGGKASTKKLKKMLQVVCEDGMVRGAFLFYGAHTGRFAGRLIQPQNFTRGEYSPQQLEDLFELIMKRDAELIEMFHDWPIDALAQGMRGYIKAPLDKKFVVVDFSAIEARVLVWLARSMKTLALYHQNADLYKLLAVKLYKLASVNDVTFMQRKFSKDLYLGSGFQLGWRGFVMNCLKRGIVISDDEAKAGINVYREDQPEVVDMWADVERCAIEAVATDATQSAPVILRNISFFVKGVWFCIKLPSGRLLRYPYPEVQNTVRYNKPVKKLTFRTEIKGKWVREGTYGGKLVENIVQAIARDLMVEGCLNAESKGYAVIGTVHDELIAMVDKRFGSADELVEIMRQKPRWAGDCPVNAEGWQGGRYRK